MTSQLTRKSKDDRLHTFGDFSLVLFLWFFWTRLGHRLMNLVGHQWMICQVLTIYVCLNQNCVLESPISDFIVKVTTFLNVKNHIGMNHIAWIAKNFFKIRIICTKIWIAAEVVERLDYLWIAEDGYESWGWNVWWLECLSMSMFASKLLQITAILPIWSKQVILPFEPFEAHKQTSTINVSTPMALWIYQYWIQCSSSNLNAMLIFWVATTTTWYTFFENEYTHIGCPIFWVHVLQVWIHEGRSHAHYETICTAQYTSSDSSTAKFIRTFI